MAAARSTPRRPFVVRSNCLSRVQTQFLGPRGELAAHSKLEAVELKAQRASRRRCPPLARRLGSAHRRLERPRCRVRNALCLSLRCLPLAIVFMMSVTLVAVGLANKRRARDAARREAFTTDAPSKAFSKPSCPFRAAAFFSLAEKNSTHPHLTLNIHAQTRTLTGAPELPTKSRCSPRALRSSM